MLPLNHLAFTTRRLNVFMCELQPSENHVVRRYYLAFRNYEDHPVVVATATVGPSFNPDFNWTLDALNLVSELGTVEHGVELWDGIENELDGDLEPFYEIVGEHEKLIYEARINRAPAA